MVLFLWTLGILAIGAVGMLTTGVIGRRIGQENLKSLVWIEKNRRKLMLMAAPAMVLFYPAVEEVIFRLWLVAVFDSMTPMAWVCTIASAAVFSWIHKFNNYVRIEDVYAARGHDGHVGDNALEAMATMTKDHRISGKIRFRKAFALVQTFALGVACGYFAIVLHEIWVAFAIHAAWNIFSLTWGALRPLPLPLTSPSSQ